MNLQDAIGYIGTLDNASGQICQMKDGKPHLLLFDFSCANCSEVESRNADDMGEALAAIVNAVPALFEMLKTLSDGLEWNIENNPTVMNESDNEALAEARALIVSLSGDQDA